MKVLKKLFNYTVLALILSFSNSAIAALTCSDLNGAYLYSQEFNPKYLGFFGNSVASESINNSTDEYGASYKANSVRSTFGQYGGGGLLYSAQNSGALSPPKIFKNGIQIGYLTSNPSFNSVNGYSLSVIDSSCTFTASGPSLQPAGLTGLISIGFTSSANLSWTATPLATSYNVYQCNDSSCSQSILLGETSTTSTAINSLTPLNTYYFAVQPKNTTGFGAYAITEVVTLADTVAPVITLTGESTVSVALGGSYTDAGATANDAVDGVVSVTTSGTVDVNTIGVYTITYNAVDTAGNNAIAVTRTVSVVTLNSLDILDTDNDGLPDTCDEACLELGVIADTDDDNDGVLDTSDVYPLVAIGELVDTDSDGAPDTCDETCVELGMTADDDDDNDGIVDTSDAYPLISLGELVDTDSDGAPDTCDETCVELGMLADTDDDNDGIVDTSDAYPLVAIGDLTDTDTDGAPDTCDETCVELGMLADTDDDNDGVLDTADVYPLVAIGDLVDTDSDGAPDVCDEACTELGMAADDDKNGDGINELIEDTDNDGVFDIDDEYPTISRGIYPDTDDDGIPDECDELCIELGMSADSDDDGDAIDDADDFFPKQSLNMIDYEQIGDLISFGGRVDISHDGNTIMIFNHDYTDDEIQGKGKVAVFNYVEGAWIQKGSVFIGSFEYNRVGYSAALNANGDKVSILTYRSFQGESNTAVIRNYSYVNNDWKLFGNEINIESAKYIDVSADGKVLIVLRSPGVSRYELQNNVWNLVHEADYVNGDYISVSSNAEFLSFQQENDVRDSRLYRWTGTRYQSEANNVSRINKSGEIAIDKDNSFVKVFAQSGFNQQFGQYTYSNITSSSLYGAKSISVSPSGRVFAVGTSLTEKPTDNVIVGSLIIQKIGSYQNDLSGSIRLKQLFGDIDNVIADNKRTIELDNYGKTIVVSSFGSDNTVVYRQTLSSLSDYDRDGIPDSCDYICLSKGLEEDLDDDNDGVNDDNDFFPLDATEILDTDLDGVGNNQDTDDDNDDIPDTADAYPLVAIGNLVDTDSDGAPDTCDEACVELGMIADDDDDNDGIVDTSDAYPLISLGELVDTDSDGAPDTCDEACVELGMLADDDDDNDGIVDTSDAYPLISIGELVDTDSDGAPDTCDDACVELGMIADTDDDNDGVLDTADAFPLVAIGDLDDTDSDGAPDTCDEACVELGMTEDTDDDNDNILDVNDGYPLIPLNITSLVGVTVNDLTWMRLDISQRVIANFDAGRDDKNEYAIVKDLISNNVLEDWRHATYSEYLGLISHYTGQELDIDISQVGSGLFSSDRVNKDGSQLLQQELGLISTVYNEGAQGLQYRTTGHLETDDGIEIWSEVVVYDYNNISFITIRDRDSQSNPDDSVGAGAWLVIPSEQFNETLQDSDLDGIPDNCDVICSALGMADDTDDDNDGVLDTADAYPLISIGELVDTDSDGAPDNCDEACVELGMIADTDDDNDGVLDTADAYPLISVIGYTDTDSDGVPDTCDEACVELGMAADTDDDNDGVPDEEDVFPQDSTKTTLLDDETAPVVIAPADIYVDAAGELTAVDVGLAEVEDNLEVLVAVADKQSPFASGETVVTWSAVDSAGNVGTAVQRIFIQPYVEIAANARVGQGDSLSVPVTLSGASYSYPVLIPVSVDVEGVSLSTSEIEIRSGMSAILEVTLPASESLLASSFDITLDTPTNAVLGANKVMQVAIVEDAAPPKVSLVVTQDDVLGRYITQTDSDVAIEVFIDDVNGNHAIGWDVAPGLTDIIDDSAINVIRFNPQALAPGNYPVTVNVADDGLPDQLFTRELTLKVSGFSKLLDADDDGIPDDVDITLASNAIQLSQSSTDIVQANAGVKLILGNTAADNDEKGIAVDETDLPVADALLAYPLGLLDFEAQLNVPGEALELVVPLSQGIPDNAIYRKLIDGRWRDFVSGDGNGIASALLNDDGVCPLASSDTYQAGLTAGDTCLRLTIVDGGPNDADGQINGHVVDPGGIAIVDEDAGIPAYTYLEQPEPQFATLTPTAKVIVTGSQGDNFFDIARYVNDVSLVGQSFLVSGSGSVDGFMVMPGVKYDLANLKGGVDAIYFSGPFAEYADSILLDPGSGVMQLSRLTDIGEEIVQFIATASAADVLVFTDGAISTSAIKDAIINETSMDDLVLDSSVSALDTKPISGGTVKHIVLDNNGAGVMALGPNISTLISGSSGIDHIYVPAGSVVDASNLKSGQDEIYLEGALADYSLTLDNSGNITLTRDVTVNDEDVTEQVTVASGGNVATNDLVIFADQQLPTQSLKQQYLN